MSDVIKNAIYRQIRTFIHLYSPNTW